MCIYIHTCVCIWVCMYGNIIIYIYVYEFTHLHIHVHTYRYIYIHMYMHLEDIAIDRTHQILSAFCRRERRLLRSLHCWHWPLLALIGNCLPFLEKFLFGCVCADCGCERIWVVSVWVSRWLQTMWVWREEWAWVWVQARSGRRCVLQEWAPYDCVFRVQRLWLVILDPSSRINWRIYVCQTSFSLRIATRFFSSSSISWSVDWSDMRRAILDLTGCLPCDECEKIPAFGALRKFSRHLGRAPGTKPCAAPASSASSATALCISYVFDSVFLDFKSVYTFSVLKSSVERLGAWSISILIELLTFNMRK